jgi:hypothetical protein
MNSSMRFALALALTGFAGGVRAQTNWPVPVESPHPVRLSEVRLRDCCVWPDTNTQMYYLVSSTDRRGTNGRPAVIEYTSKDLETWAGPRVIFEIPEDFWAQRGIWAPELHAYRGNFTCSSRSTRTTGCRNNGATGCPA